MWLLALGKGWGDALSPIVFNLILEKVAREANTTGGLVLENLNTDLLTYVDDDIAVLSNTEEDIKQLCWKILTIAGTLGFVINDKKTEYMIINCLDEERHSMNLERYASMEVIHFKYLVHLQIQKFTSGNQ